MNAALVKKALETLVNAKGLNANISVQAILINLVSRRVRQLHDGGGGASRPLVAEVAHLGAADIALTEIIEGKMGFDMAAIEPLVRPTGRNRKRPQGWVRN
jgi:hypothetical protein